jgi:hypothetical protein
MTAETWLFSAHLRGPHRSSISMCRVLLIAVSSLACASAFDVSRRAALNAVVALPLAASAGGKASVLPNKPEGVGANAGQYLSEYRKKEYEAMAGDKGYEHHANAPPASFRRASGSCCDFANAPADIAGSINVAGLAALLASSLKRTTRSSTTA